MWSPEEDNHAMCDDGKEEKQQVLSRQWGKMHRESGIGQKHPNKYIIIINKIEQPKVEHRVTCAFLSVAVCASRESERGRAGGGGCIGKSLRNMCANGRKKEKEQQKRIKSKGNINKTFWLLLPRFCIPNFVPFFVSFIPCIRFALFRRSVRSCVCVCLLETANVNLVRLAPYQALVIQFIRKCLCCAMRCAAPWSCFVFCLSQILTLCRKCTHTHTRSLGRERYDGNSQNHCRAILLVCAACSFVSFDTKTDNGQNVMCRNTIRVRERHFPEMLAWPLHSIQRIDAKFRHPISFVWRCQIERATLRAIPHNIREVNDLPKRLTTSNNAIRWLRWWRNA